VEPLRAWAAAWSLDRCQCAEIDAGDRLASVAATRAINALSLRATHALIDGSSISCERPVDVALAKRSTVASLVHFPSRPSSKVIASVGHHCRRGRTGQGPPRCRHGRPGRRTRRVRLGLDKGYGAPCTSRRSVVRGLDLITANRGHCHHR